MKTRISVDPSTMQAVIENSLSYIKAMQAAEVAVRAAWTEQEVRRAIPRPVVWLLRRTGWLWLARATRVSILYHRHRDMTTSVYIVKRRKIVAHRRFGWKMP